MSEEIKFCRKGMEKFIKSVSKDVLEIVKGETHHPCLAQTINTTSLNDVRKLINDAMDFWLYDEDRNIACSCGMYECPIKTAQDLYSKVDAETIQKVWNEIPYSEYNHMEKYLGILVEVAYLQEHCKFIKGTITKVINSGKVRKSRLIKVANVIQTVGLSKEFFEDFIKFNTIQFWGESFEININEIWQKALKFKKGVACKICCQQETHFEDLDTPETTDEGGSQCAS